jgi:hypothetical protein
VPRRRFIRRLAVAAAITVISLNLFEAATASPGQPDAELFMSFAKNADRQPFSAYTEV